MPQIRVVFLWHMHQPFYKDLVTGEYRLPWVRMHALKDYFGMVKLLEEFPQAHQTFNLVPSLLLQIQDYASGTARDPLLELVRKPAAELSPEERRFALHSLFFANPPRMIQRYPRYADLWSQADSPEKVEIAQKQFSAQDFTDLQVLSQIAWFDEFFLQEPEVAELARKGRNFTGDEQQRVVALEQQFIGRVLTEYSAAARRGAIEISTSPFYHPILPLLCDTNQGRVSCGGLPLPERFQHPEDARAQLRRALEFQEKSLGVRPQGAWPSEGSVSEEVLKIASDLGLKWMATDEGVLGRSLRQPFERDGNGRLQPESAERLYRVYRYEQPDAAISLLFRDHSLSDLIGFAYSGMEAQHAAEHFVQSIKDSAQPVLDKSLDATVSIILDGENAWEHYHQSGRDFLRRLYAGMASAGIEMLTASEAVARESPAKLSSLVPGSWINANFNVWIGAPEDNRSWNYLRAARDFYGEQLSQKNQPQEKLDLAYEEVLISEGSDWNWWYGPEHHSANDRDFDELYRKHLSNVYHALGAAPPEYLAQSIIETGVARTTFVPQTSYIHPAITGDTLRYFDWIGAAVLSADSRDSAMHGHVRVLDRFYAGVDAEQIYGRLDIEKNAFADLLLIIHMEAWNEGTAAPERGWRLEIQLRDRQMEHWRLSDEREKESATGNGAGAGRQAPAPAKVRFGKILEFSIPLSPLGARIGGKLRLRASAWREGLPLDSLPPEGWLELLVASEEKLGELV